MDTSPRQIALELFRENQNASLYEIRFCTEAEAHGASPAFLIEVIEEYEKLQSAEDRAMSPRALHAEDRLWSRPHEPTTVSPMPSSKQ